MTPLAEAAGVAMALSAASLGVALLAGSGPQIAFAGALLFASGVLMKLSWKS